MNEHHYNTGLFASIADISRTLAGSFNMADFAKGGGWDNGQDLRDMKIDSGAGRNRRMFLEVKKWDRILIPHLPQYGQITIAEATEDWDQGYSFSIWQKSGDHGHIFPARILRNFRRTNSNIPASIKGTFRNLSRFWKITSIKKDIEDVLSLPVEDLAPTALVVDHWHQQVEDVVTESGLHRRLFTEASKFFSNSDWEYLLTDVLQRLNPGWKVKRTGGKAEAKHGTDILATIPNLFRDGQYGIAIQVKDYEGFVNDDPIHAILKAKEGFWKDRGIEIVELVIVVVQGDKQAAHQLEESAKKAGVNVIWSSDVEELVFLAACNFLSDSESHFSFDQSS